jgi:hypothetical protein
MQNHKIKIEAEIKHYREIFLISLLFKNKSHSHSRKTRHKCNDKLDKYNKSEQNIHDRFFYFQFSQLILLKFDSSTNQFTKNSILLCISIILDNRCLVRFYRIIYF